MITFPYFSCVLNKQPAIFSWYALRGKSERKKSFDDQKKNRREIERDRRREREQKKKTFDEICMDETRKVISQLFDIYRRQYLTLKNNLNIDILVARYCSDVMCRSGTSALSAWCQ